MEIEEAKLYYVANEIKEYDKQDEIYNKIWINDGKSKESKMIRAFSFLNEYLQHVVKGQITIDKCLNFFKALKDKDLFDPNTTLEIIWMLGLEVEKFEKTDPKGSKDLKNNYVNLIIQLDNQNLIERSTVLERLEENQLADANFIDKNQFLRKKTRVNTKNNYESQKYNLFREENEGYAKLITELLQDEYITESQINIVIHNITSLIGYFDLDPNRVLDVILDAYECYPNNITYHQIIKIFKAASIPHILGFKLATYNALKPCNTIIPLSYKYIPGGAIVPISTSGNAYNTNMAYYTGNYVNDPYITPANLIKITANLLKYGLIEIEDIWPHLSPADDEIEKSYHYKMGLSQSILKNVFAPKLTNKEEEQQKKDKEAEIQKIVEIKSQLLYNQKLALLEALIRINAFEKAEIIFDLIGNSFDMNSHLPLANALLQYIDWIIEPIYRPISPSKFTNRSIKIVEFPYDKDLIRNGSANTNDNISNTNSNYQLSQAKAFDLDLFEKLLKIMRHLGTSISNNLITYTKVCRIIKHYLKSPITDSITHIKIIDIIQYITTQILLPAITLIPRNPGIVSTLWTIMQDFDYLTRYEAYEDWATHWIYTSPLLMLETGITLKETRKWLRRLTPETMKQQGRLLGNFSHNNPVLVFKEVVLCVKNYSNIIQHAVNAFNCCSNLTLDVIVYLILRDISSPKSEKMENDGNLKEWLVNLANFMGFFLRKNYSVDITGVFNYLCNRLLKNQHQDLVLLKEIVSKMSGCEVIENMNENQLKALAGGILLQMEAASLTNDFRKAKKSSSALKNFLFKKTLNSLQIANDKDYYSLTFVLLICLGQLRGRLLYDENTHMELKLIGNLFDKVNEILIQFVQFLRYHTNESFQLYSMLLPKDSLHKMIIKYKLSPEVAYHIYRQSVKPIHLMSEDEKTDIISTIKKTFDDCNPDKYYKSKEALENLTPEAVIYSIKNQIWEKLTPEFYAIFWLLNLDNIYVPTERYDEEIQRIKDELQIEQGKYSSENNRQAKSKREKNIGRLETSRDNFENERQKLLQNKEKVDNFLMQHKDLFPPALEKGKPKITANDLAIQVCFYPRCVFSPGDAIFCAKFVEILNKIKNSLYEDILHRIYNLTTKIIPRIQWSSEREAHNMGIFFSELFKTVAIWNDEHKLKQEAKTNSTHTPDYLQYAILAIFTRVRTIILNSLTSKEYMQVRNSLVFLNQISHVFPPIAEDAELLLSAIENLQKEFSDKGDIKKFAESYYNSLNKRKPTLPKIDRKKLKEKAQPRKPKSSTASTTPSQGQSQATTTTTATTANVQTPVTSGSSGTGNTGSSLSSTQQQQQPSETNKSSQGRDQATSGTTTGSKDSSTGKLTKPIPNEENQEKTKSDSKKEDSKSKKAEAEPKIEVGKKRTRDELNSLDGISNTKNPPLPSVSSTGSSNIISSNTNTNTTMANASNVSTSKKQSEPKLEKVSELDTENLNKRDLKKVHRDEQTTKNIANPASGSSGARGK